MNWRDPNQRKEYKAAFYKSKRSGSFENRLKDLLYSAKKRAKRKGIEFNLTQDDFCHQTHCRILKNIEFDFKVSGYRSDNSMSIDKIDPQKGYTPDNVWLISWRANRIKNDATLEELEAIVNSLKEVKKNG